MKTALKKNLALVAAMLVGAMTLSSPAGEDPSALARKLVAQMTLEEKVSQSYSDAPAVPRLGLPAYEWWGEALHGVARAGSATVFPQAIGRAAAFDAALEGRIGRAIGTEARAKYNLFQKKGYRGRYAGLTLWNPNVNMFRDPRWGRGQETFGEDPFLSGTLGAALVRGMQGDDPARLLTAACAKHYLVHSGPEPGRRAFDAKTTERDMREYYLPAFEALVKDARVEDVMTSYNRINGKSASACPEFVDGILRGEWGHRGHVSSDYGAIEALYEDHKLADSRAKTAAAAIAAGVDLCAGWDYKHLADAVRQGILPEATLTRAVERLMTTRARLGILPGQPHHRYDDLGAESVDTPAHRALALECAEKSIVLVANRGSVLPLDREKTSHICVAGPLAMDEFVLYGNYNGYNSRMSTVVGGLCEVGGPAIRFRHEDGCEVSGKRQPGLSFGWDSQDAQAFVVCVGYTAALEGEEGTDDALGGSGDRVKFSLPGRQVELLKQARELAGKRPVVAVVFGGSPIDLKEIEQYADAVLLAWYPGEEGGKAIARVIFGDVNPSGRLPFTVPASYADLPDFRDYSLVGRTYLYATKKPQYPFGYGLSYTTFAYENGKAKTTGEGERRRICVSVEVTNTGKKAGDEVVQAYVRAPADSGDRRLHHLAGFVRVRLDAGETREVTVELPQTAFLVYDKDGKRRLPPGDSTVFIGGGQPGFAETVSVGVHF